MAYNPRDSYFKKAKLEGYRSRAAYKLIELHQRFRLFRPGDAVVDLGAAPGGWLQVAAKAVGPNGKVIGVDLQAIKPFNERNIALLEGYITTADIQAKIKVLIGAPADSVLSDLHPNSAAFATPTWRVVSNSIGWRCKSPSNYYAPAARY